MTATDTAPFHFVAARPEHADAMHALAVAAYRHYVERMPQPPAPMLLDYRDVAAAGDTTLAWRGGTLSGMVTVVIEPEGVLVENVAVHPASQGSGLGSMLLAHAEHLARAAGRIHVRLYTNEAMTENLAYYPRRGFIEVGRAEVDGYRRVFFEKLLDADATAPSA